MWQQQVNLQRYNTLNIAARAAYLSEIDSLQSLRDVLIAKQQQFPDLPLLVIGGGSNLVFKQDFPGLVLVNGIKGIEVIRESASDITLKVGAGENWDQFVAFTLQQGWYGLENLSAIPGTVGATPIQNIGAYGVELSAFLVAVDVLDVQSLVSSEISAADCQLGYRDSVFKRELKNQKVICSVTLTLNKQPNLKLDYADIPQRMAALAMDAQSITPMQLRQLITAIRSEKLPDPKILPNAGSFFKNPVVSAEHFAQLKQRFPDIVAFEVGQGVKLAAGWLIDQLGWKGKYEGQAQVHERQALVLVNHGDRGEDLIALAEAIQADVHQYYGVELEPEPNII